MPTKRLPLHILAWTCALLPFITTHACYLLAANYGHVDWCNPYLDSCTSISATGRQFPEKILFKLGMIPAALITALTWWHIRRWLIESDIDVKSMSLMMLLLGILASCFLAMYVIALGEEGDNFRLMRRTGVTLAFALTFLAQLLCTRQLGMLGRRQNNKQIQTWSVRLMALLLLLLATGIATLVLDATLGTGYDAIEDAFEWHMALLLNCWFAGIALLLTPAGSARQ